MFLGGGGGVSKNRCLWFFYHRIQVINIKNNKFIRQSEFMENRGFTGRLNDQCTLSSTHLMPVGSCV